MNKSTIILLALSGLLSCQSNSVNNDVEAPTLKEIPSPAKEGGESNLFVSAEDQVYLSWVEYLNDTTDALVFSQLENGQWGEARQIAQGSDWFVNWADFPSLVAFKGRSGYLAAHWLQKSASGTYDYDVRIALSKDNGQSWSPSFIPHTDGIAAEHGFVSMLPLDNGRIFATWLDGRNTKGEATHDGSHAHRGAMTLRTAEFDSEGRLFEEAELDARICDCCQTDATLTPEGPIVVYRDRSEEEIRDISIVRKVNGKWTAPQKVFNDQWKIAGCPVNGPAISAQGQTVVIVWYTEGKGKKQVKVAFSKDAGANFSEPIRIDDGDPAGRVDVVFSEEGMALVSWLEQIGTEGDIRLATITADGKIGESTTLTQTSTSRQSGFPILEKYVDGYLLAWTQVDSLNTVRTAYFLP